MSNVILLKLNESATDIAPSDSEGNVLDFEGDTGATPDLELPEVVEGLTGYARRFTENDGGQADDIDSAALLERDLSIQTLIKIDVAAQDALGDPGIVIANAGAWQLQIEIVNATSSIASIRLGWSAASEADADISGAAPTVFVAPDGYILLTVTRHWNSSTDVRVRYYGNMTLIAEVTSTYGDVDGAAADPVTLGCRPNGADYEYFLEADVDGILVTDHEMTIEEIRQTYLRISKHQPEGRDMLQPMLAAGGAYTSDPDSGIQREIMVEGDGLGSFYSRNQELREDYLPDRAWSTLTDWERVCRLPPGALDTVETRRSRLVSYWRMSHGYSEEDVQNALTEVLDLAASDIEIINYTNRYTDDFATAVADYWSEISPAGAVAISSGAARFTLDNAADGRWMWRDDSNGPTILRLPIDGHPNDTEPSDDADIQVKIVDDLTSNFDNGDHVGLCMWNLAGDLMFYGFRKDAGAISLGYLSIIDGTVGAWTGAAISPPMHIRLQFRGSTDWRVVYHVTDPDDTTNQALITGIDYPLNSGIIMMQTAASNPSLTQVDVDDWRAYFPNGLRVFDWYAYADPALGGTPDLDGARAIIERMKPADSDGSAVATATGYLEAGDGEHGCGEAPCK